jgi:predicted TIM-barrel fold metal-dependent hydrolase
MRARLVTTLVTLAAALLAATETARSQGAPRRVEPARRPPPIIDMHLHADAVASAGPPPPVCVGDVTFLARDARDSLTYQDFARLEACPRPRLTAPATDEALMRGTLAVMERYNVIGVTSGPIEFVRRWQAAAPARIIPATYQAPLDSVRTWAKDGTIRVLGELAFQYGGVGPGDSIPETYYALAEQLDLPVALHIGPGPPGAAYIVTPQYRMRHSNPLLLEDVLLRHPRLRLYVMHAGWPMGDEMIALLYAHPQVYVDLGVISWTQPTKEFHRYLRRLVEAGYGQRVMFGSDQMAYPDALRIAIEHVESADFLTPAQKRDIFYNNAVRFLRLPPNGVPRAAAGRPASGRAAP